LRIFLTASHELERVIAVLIFSQFMASVKCIRCHMVLKMQQEASSNLELVVKVLDVLIAIGRLILPVTVASALLCAAAAVNSVATGNVGGTIFWVFLTAIGTIFAVQIVQKRMHRKTRRTPQVRAELATAAQA
jgi:hypothetical protein